MVPNKQLAGYLHTQNWEKNAAPAAIFITNSRPGRSCLAAHIWYYVC